MIVAERSFCKSFHAYNPSNQTVHSDRWKDSNREKSIGRKVTGEKETILL